MCRSHSPNHGDACGHPCRGVGVFDDEVDQLISTLGVCFLTEVIGQLPGLRFVNPHQGCLDQQATVHAERQRNLHGLHGVVAAVGVAREIGFAHACNDDIQVTAIGQGRSQGEKQQVAPRHKGVGQARGFHLERHVARQGCFAHLTQHAKV